jgi:hypothetical protein
MSYTTIEQVKAFKSGLSEYALLCHKHDWYYQMSDDSCDYHNGLEVDNALRAIAYRLSTPYRETFNNAQKRAQDKHPGFPALSPIHAAPSEVTFTFRVTIPADEIGKYGFVTMNRHLVKDALDRTLQYENLSVTEVHRPSDEVLGMVINEYQERQAAK